VKIEAVFVRSAASAADLPGDGIPELALVGRSNVGKSSLINGLVRQRVARTSGAPGKTRLANIYRVRRGSGPSFYLVDLPGYGHARGDRSELEAIARFYFGRDRQERQIERGTHPAAPAHPALPAVSALLLIDARHPGLESDLQAWSWLNATTNDVAIVATKIDKLSRAERLRAMAANEAVFEHPVLPVSADTGEGLDELWKLIDRLLSSRRPQPRLSSSPPSRTAPADSRPRRRPRS
jgi:GTP-binding protein